MGWLRDRLGPGGRRTPSPVERLPHVDLAAVPPHWEAVRSTLLQVATDFSGHPGSELLVFAVRDGQVLTEVQMCNFTGPADELLLSISPPPAVCHVLAGAGAVPEQRRAEYGAAPADLTRRDLPGGTIER